MNKEELQSLTQQLAAIEMPLQPDWQHTIIVSVIFTATIILIFSVFFLRRHHSQQHQDLNTNQEAIGRLELLHNSWQAGLLDDQTIAYRLATLLRLGLKLKQLTTHPPINLIEDKASWQETVELLQTLRYTKSQKTKLDSQTFVQIRHWLSHGAVRC